MGSYSVYCGLSNITIDGDCLILPIKKRHKLSHNYIPSLLPIFGNYADCGRIDDIEENENTKLLEDYFGVPINNLMFYFTERHRGEGHVEFIEIESKIKHLDELEEMEFMWIDKKVYDFFAKSCDCTYISAGYLDCEIKIHKIYNKFVDIYDKSLETEDNTILNNFKLLLAIIHSIGCCSMVLEPYKICITPQGGEHEEHLKILEGFVEILKGKILEEYDEFDEFEL